MYKEDFSLELTRKNIHTTRAACRSTLQLNLNDDINVPDTKPDLAFIMKVSGDLSFEEQKILSGKLYLKGTLTYQILYLSAEEDHQIHNITGKLPFDETIRLDSDCSAENLCIRHSFEDLSANLINSRKISLKSLVQITISADELFDESVCVDVSCDAPVCTRTELLHPTGLTACRKDTYRLRDELVLPSSKNCIRELLYHTLTLKNIDIRLLNNQFSLKGELSAFFLYAAEEGEVSTEYYEAELPFHTVIECNGCTENMIPDIRVHISDKNIDVRQDSDGENRVFSLDVLMELQIRLYEEYTLEIIRDLYSPALSLTPVFRPVTYESLLLHNTSRTRINDRSKLPHTAPKILQICHGSGTANIDSITASEDGLILEGYVDADVFYITPEDVRPMYSVRITVPFEHTVEVHNLSSNSVYTVTPELEQLTILPGDSDEMEIKASLLFNCMVFDRFQDNLLDSVTEEPLNYQEIMNLPGMTGYIVKENDTLWDIAKSHHTTEASIQELNDLTDKSVTPGMHLLLLKEILP